MAIKDEIGKLPAAARQEKKGDLVQYKLNLHSNDIEKLKRYAENKGIGHTTAARMIIVEFLNKL